jgi:hypothetical protein
MKKSSSGKYITFATVEAYQEVFTEENVRSSVME